MKPYYEDGTVTIYHADCRDVLPFIKADLAVTSPPYNLGRQSGDYANMRDGYLSHGDDLPEAEYVAWQQETLALLWDVVAPTGAIFYNHKPIIREGVALLPTRLLPPDALLRQIIIWDRRVGMNWNPRHFCPQHEWVMVIAHRDFQLSSRSHSAAGDVWDFPVDQSKEGHPCAFPATIPATAISATDARVVVDPFAGSGTTLRAAKDLNRKAIGIEIEERYCEIAAQRMGQEVLNLAV